jgi:hypothetical protein
MTSLRLLTLVFLMMAVYGYGANKHGPMVMSLGMAIFTLYGERKMRRQDSEHEKYVRIKQTLILTSEHMLDLHGCEASAVCIYNPSVGMQVAD